MAEEIKTYEVWKTEFRKKDLSTNGKPRVRTEDFYMAEYEKYVKGVKKEEAKEEKEAEEEAEAGKVPGTQWPNMPGFSISEAANLYGVSECQVQCYIDNGLLLLDGEGLIPYVLAIAVAEFLKKRPEPEPPEPEPPESAE